MDTCTYPSASPSKKTPNKDRPKRWRSISHPTILAHRDSRDAGEAGLKSESQSNMALEPPTPLPNIPAWFFCKASLVMSDSTKAPPKGAKMPARHRCPGREGSWTAAEPSSKPPPSRFEGRICVNIGRGPCFFAVLHVFSWLTSSLPFV